MDSGASVAAGGPIGSGAAPPPSEKFAYPLLAAAEDWIFFLLSASWISSRRTNPTHPPSAPSPEAYTSLPSTDYPCYRYPPLLQSFFESA